jgi:hypothetical protein
MQYSAYSLSSIALVFWSISKNILESVPLDTIKLQSNAGKYNSVKIFPMLQNTSTGKFLKVDR